MNPWGIQQMGTLHLWNLGMNEPGFSPPAFVSSEGISTLQFMETLV